MDNGLTFAKNYGLKPGIELTKEQMAALTTDIVWLVTEKVTLASGETVEVIVPKVYLHNGGAKILTPEGALISGSKVVMDLKENLNNSGTIVANTDLGIKATTIDTSGQLGGNRVILQTSGDMNVSGTVVADKAAVLQSGGDLNITTKTYTTTNGDGSKRTDIDRVAGIAVTGNDGVLVVSAKENLTVSGAQLVNLSEKGATILEAGKNVTLDTVHTDNYSQGIKDKDNYMKEREIHDVGSSVQAKGNISIQAGQDVTAKAAYIGSSNGAVTVQAAGNVSLTAGEDTSHEERGFKFKESGFLSSTTTTSRVDNYAQNVHGTTLTGDSVTVVAGKHVSGTATSIVGTHDVTIGAGEDISLTSAEAVRKNTNFTEVKTSGLMGAGLGFTIGTKDVKDTGERETHQQVGSQVVSLAGKVTMVSGKDIHLTTTDVVGKESITLNGENVTLDAKNSTDWQRTTHETKQTGLTVSVGGAIANSINAAMNYMDKAGSRDDKRLAAFETYEAGKEIRDGAMAIHNFSNFTPAVLQKTYAEGIAHGKDLMENGAKVMHTSHSFEEANRGAFDYAKGADEVKENTRKLNDLNGDKSEYRKEKQAKKDQLINIHVGFGSDSSKQVTEITSSATAGGRLASEGTITVVARGDGKEGNVTAVGETIKGKDVIIQATKDIVLEAGTNTSKEETKADSKGWGVGASIGLSGNLVSVDAHVNMAKENGVNTIVTHTPTTVVGSNSVTLASGQDTTITGSQVVGKSVDVTVGRNLTITSLQDQNNYVSDAKSAGLSVSTGFSGGVPSISGNANKSHMESTYASVTTQAGIYAGTGGVNVNVGDTTTLNGAVISSNASADKNAVTTNHLVMNDIHNKAEYSTSGMGVNYKYTPNFDKADDATRNKEYKEQGLTPNIPISASGKSASTTKSAVTEGSLKVLDGKIDSATVERNTQNTVHTLATIFDKKKLEERQALAYEFSKNANEAIHRISEANKWEDGDPRKVALHAAVGAISAELGGGSGTIGGVAGAVNEAAVKKIIQTVGTNHPDLAQLASAVLGYATDKALGGNGQTGASVSYMGTKWNEINEDMVDYNKRPLYVLDKNAVAYHILKIYYLKDGDMVGSELNNNGVYSISNGLSNLTKGFLGESPTAVIREIYLKKEQVRNMLKSGYEVVSIPWEPEEYIRQGVRLHNLNLGDQIEGEISNTFSDKIFTYKSKFNSTYDLLKNNCTEFVYDTSPYLNELGLSRDPEPPGLFDSISNYVLNRR